MSNLSVSSQTHSQEFDPDNYIQPTSNSSVSSNTNSQFIDPDQFNHLHSPRRSSSDTSSNASITWTQLLLQIQGEIYHDQEEAISVANRLRQKLTASGASLGPLKIFRERVVFVYNFPSGRKGQANIRYF